MSSNNVPINQLVLPVNYGNMDGGIGQQSLDSLYQEIMSQPRATFNYTPPAKATSTQSTADKSTDSTDYYNQIMATRSNIQPQSAMDYRDGNIARNAQKNVQKWGTSLNYIWTHMPELLNEGYEGVKDFYAGHTPIENVLRTGRQALKLPAGIINAVGETYNFNLDDIGERSLRDIIGGAIEGAVHNPADFAADALSLGGASALLKASKKIPIVGKLAKAGDVEKTIAKESVTVAKDINKLEDGLKSVNKLAKENDVNLARVIEAAETGSKVNASEKVVLKELKKFSTDYDNFAKKYATTELVGAEETAIAQKILRDRLKVNPEMTYEQVRREILPILESGEDITKLAKEGNVVAKEVAGAKALYDKGRIFPVSHALANVDRTTSTIASGIKGVADAERAGRFANRLWGTSSYEDIAKQLNKPENWLKDLTTTYADKHMADTVLRGAFGTAAEGSKHVRYIDRGLLEQGKMQEALQSLRKERLLNTDIALDADVAAELNKQVGRTKSAFSEGVNELYKMNKSAILAQGTYLGANAITGSTNVIMNSNIHILNDIIDAIRSKGNLSRELGVYRRGGLPKWSKYPVISNVQKLNYYGGGKLFSSADRWMQNKFAEIAAHAEMRRKGIPFAERAKAITDADKIDIGQTIFDIKRAALIDTGNLGVLPKWAAEIASAINPFYRWNITATQSTFRMLEKNPLMANVVLLDILGNIGFDKEMQNRLNLGVTLDKPYVSFKMDKNGNMRQMSSEFVPMGTTIKTFDPASDSFATSANFISALVNSAKGIDKYGRPMKRAVSPDGIVTQTVGTKRIEYDPNTGEFRPAGGHADEFLSTVVKSFIGAPNLYNRTIGPTLAPALGEGGQFYQPYDQSMLGSFSRNEQGNNMIVGGNALRGRSAEDIIKVLSGVYDTPYYESEDIVSPSQQRRFMRSYIRDQQRRFYGEE